MAYAAGALAVAHAVLGQEVDNSATGLTSILYNCIAREASQLAGAPEPSFEVPPVLSQALAGPASGRSRRTGELTAAGDTVTEVPAGRVISLAGAQFSPLRDHNLVKVDGRLAPLAALPSGALLTTAVPFLHRELPARVEVQVVVRGVPSRPLALTVVRPERAPEAPSILAKRLLGKQYLLARQIRAEPWAELADDDDAPAARRRAAAAQLDRCAADLLVQLKSFDTKLNQDARFLEVHEMVLHASPEVEELVDQALAALPPALAQPR